MGRDQFIYHAGYVTGCDWAQIIIVAGTAHPASNLSLPFKRTINRTIATIKNRYNYVTNAQDPRKHVTCAAGDNDSDGSDSDGPQVRAHVAGLVIL